MSLSSFHQSFISCCSITYSSDTNHVQHCGTNIHQVVSHLIEYWHMNKYPSFGVTYGAVCGALQRHCNASRGRAYLLPLARCFAQPLRFTQLVGQCHLALTQHSLALAFLCGGCHCSCTSLHGAAVSVHIQTMASPAPIAAISPIGAALFSMRLWSHIVICRSVACEPSDH